MSAFKLVCLIFGDPIENAFSIDIGRNRQISHLKNAIKEKNKHRFEQYDANELELWKVNIPISDKSKFEQLKIDTPYELVLKNVLKGVLITDGTKKIKKIFNTSPEDEHIHIIVKPSETAHHKETFEPEVILTMNKNVDFENGIIMTSNEVIPWLSSVSDESLLQSDTLCRTLLIPFCRSNDVNKNRKEMDRLALGAYGRTASEAFNRNICVVCGVQPKRFHNDASRQEYERISRICPACWETETLPPDESMDEIKRSRQILLNYGRELILREQLPHAWKCLFCKKVIQGKERLTHNIKCREI